MERVLVNMRQRVNAAGIRYETRHGREVVVVPSATMPDNIVMNGIRYPADEIAKSYKTLERTLAPLGHPYVDGQYVSANSPEGISVGWFGAYNENVRRENGRVFLDKVIDVARAKESEAGRRVLEAIQHQKPIHTSTGVILDLKPAENDPDATQGVATNMTFDHDAFLLDEPGAATPAQGVGIFVNSGKPEKLRVVHSWSEELDAEFNQLSEMLVDKMKPEIARPFIEKVKEVMLAVFGAHRASEQEETEVSEVSKEAFDALAAQVADLKAGIASAVAEAVAPVTEAVTALNAAAKAKEDAERNELVAKVVAANALDEATAKDTPVAALRALVANAGTSGAAAAAFAGGESAKGLTLSIPE